MAHADRDLEAAWVESLRSAILGWEAPGRQGLPWRDERDAYRVLVSEFMLVQTTVAAVVGPYHLFLKRFPSVRALCEAGEEEVLRAWEGLGYYRRARQLHAAAGQIVREHGGQVPSDPAVLRRLPGVGRYIAGAVASLAFGRREAILEANTQRVLARLLTWAEPLDSSGTRARLWLAAERLVPDDLPGRFNQNLMDLGATVCLPRAPRCLLCPAARLCGARQLGIVDRIPVSKPRVAPRPVEETCVAVERDGKLLCLRRSPDALWGGFWELPTAHRGGADPARRTQGLPLSLEAQLEQAAGIRVRLGPVLKQVRYTVTTHRVTLEVHRGTDLGGSPRPGPGFDASVWVGPEDRLALPFGSAQRRILRWLESAASGRGESQPSSSD